MGIYSSSLVTFKVSNFLPDFFSPVPQIPEEADPRFCHQEEDRYLPNLSHPQAAWGGSLCLLQATEVDPQSLRRTECLPRGPTWAQSLIAFPLQYLIRQDPFSQVCTTGGPNQCLGPRSSPALGRFLPLFPETEVLLLEEALSVRAPQAPTHPSPTGLPCPLPRAEPWMTNPLRHLLQWAAGPPSTGRGSRCRPRRTASRQCLPPRGLPPRRRPRLRHRHPVGRALPTCLLVPVAVTKSQGSHSGICLSRPHRHLPYLHLDVQVLFLLRPVRDPLLQ